MPRPLIIEYTNLLHKYRDPNADAVKDFLKEHLDDEVFLKRAKGLNKVFRLQEQLATPSRSR